MKKLLSDHRLFFGFVSCGFYLATYIAVQADFGGRLGQLLFANNSETKWKVARIGPYGSRSALPGSGEASSKP